MTIDQVDLDTLLAEMRSALTNEDWDRAVNLVEALRPPDQADLFFELSPDTQDELLPRLNPEDSADILEELEELEAAAIATRLQMRELAPILNEMEPDEAADLLGDIAPEQVAEALLAIESAEDIKPLLVYPDESAGGLMTSAKTVLHEGITAYEAVEYLKKVVLDHEDVHYIFVVDDENLLVGVLPIYQLLVAPDKAYIAEIMDPEVIDVNVFTDQEEAARLLARYDLLALPVVDDTHHLLGMITHDDLVDVLEDEATEDIYRLGGVPDEQVTNVTIPQALRSRLPWLILNLGTAMVSAVVLSLFQETIARVAILAAFFPIVAGVSGSAGTQTLTVIVRGLALGEITMRNGLKSLLREAVIGLSDGIVVGIIVAVIAVLWQETPLLGVVVGLATLLNMTAAGVAGVVFPIGVQMLKIDPALASPILVTTFTDILGYLLYLSLATVAILQILGA